jgi:5-methylcytosine-specific restriction endonuclease McrA
MPYKAHETQRQYQSTWMWRRRMAWLIEHGPCNICGSSVDLRVVYINPVDRQVPVTSIWSRSEDRRAELLALCMVLCEVCFKSKRREERQPDHGTDGRYSQGCKCDPCKAAHATKNREYRHRKRLERARS